MEKDFFLLSASLFFSSHPLLKSLKSGDPEAPALSSLSLLLSVSPPSPVTQSVSLLPRFSVSLVPPLSCFSLSSLVFLCLSFLSLDLLKAEIPEAAIRGRVISQEQREGEAL